MTRIEALKALLAKVEGGTLTAFDCGRLAVWWPTATPFDGDKITLTTPLECMGGLSRRSQGAARGGAAGLGLGHFRSWWDVASNAGF